jgi:hypothetical protein
MVLKPGFLSRRDQDLRRAFRTIDCASFRVAGFEDEDENESPGALAPTLYSLSELEKVAVAIVDMKIPHAEFG